MDRNNKVAAVTFTNKKTRYDRYSHTDVVRRSDSYSELKYIDEIREKTVAKQKTDCYNNPHRGMA